jgi:hypothetical protein
MVKPETREEIARRLVAEAEVMVTRQQELVAALENDGRNSRLAGELLDRFETALENFRRTLALLRRP